MTRGHPGDILKRSVHRSEGSDREEISKGSLGRTHEAKGPQGTVPKGLGENEFRVFTALWAWGSGFQGCFRAWGLRLRLSGHRVGGLHSESFAVFGVLGL